jgi:hypothetical protein
MRAPLVSKLYDKGRRKAVAGDWGYNTPVTSLPGLWWLEGETVSVFHDGDATYEAVVQNGTVQLQTESAYIVVGLGYYARAKTLPLSLPNYILGGLPLTVRGVALRQLNSRGLAVGPDYAQMEELPSRRQEDWGNPLDLFTELTTAELFGAGGWAEDTFVCFEQRYPLPAGVIGFTFDLDVGE